MFAKKPVAPPKPAPAQSSTQSAPQSAPQPMGKTAGWAVQFLTTDYVASGYMTPIDMPLVGWLNVPTQAMVTLTQVLVMALDPQIPVTSEMVSEITIPKASIVAVVPRDEMSSRSATMQMPPNTEQAIIYAGPYWLRAAFRMAGGMPLRNLFGATTGDMLAVSDAEIKCLRPNAHFQAQKATAIIINKSRVQLYHPSQRP